MVIVVCVPWKEDGYVEDVQVKHWLNLGRSKVVLDGSKCERQIKAKVLYDFLCVLEAQGTRVARQ